MSRDLSLAPCGLVIDRIEVGVSALVIMAHPVAKTADCPICHSPSARIHSTYRRSLADLPSHGRAVWIKLATRRFRCVLATCSRRIFTERLAATGAHPFARRTARLEGIVHHLGLALGGRPGQSRTAPSAARQQGHLAARRSAPFATISHDPSRGGN